MNAAHGPNVVQGWRRYAAHLPGAMAQFGGAGNEFQEQFSAVDRGGVAVVRRCN